MTFDVYPTPQTAPLTLASGAPSTFTPIVQRTGTSEPPGAYQKMMFIRVAMFGGAKAPTLSIQADTGDAVVITTQTTGVYSAPFATGYLGDVQLFTTGESPNVFQIRMGFDSNATDPQTWKLGIKNNDPTVDRDFTWTVADTIAETAQPWIVVVTPPALTYHSLINQTINQSVQVSNKGTGPFTVASVNPALPAGFSLGTLPPAVIPGATTSLTFAFSLAAPPPGGQTVGTVDVVVNPADSTAGTSAGHNRRVSLVATTQELEVVLLLDYSGSMGWDKVGNPLPVGDPNSRLGELSSAAGQFLDLLAHFGQTRGRLGIARFPARDPLDTSTYDIFPMAAIPDVNGMAGPKGKIAAEPPTNSTPMGDGLDRVLATATSYFGPDTFNRRWLILMSDGAYNSGAHNPLEFIAPPTGTAPAGTALDARGVELFSVAYGIDGFSDVNHVLMKQLANGSLAGGQVRNVDDEGTTATQLAGALRDALKSGLTAAVSPLDPSSVFVIGSGQALHDTVITRFDTRAAFTLSWNTPDAGRLRLELVTPTCEVITPENAGWGAFAGVTFRGTDRSHMYLVDPDFLQPPDSTGDGGSRSRVGTWTFVVTSPGIVIGELPEARPADDEADEEPYAYDVMVDSTLRLDLAADRPTYYAGDPIVVTARLTADGPPVTGAAVSLSTTLPTEALANFLAGLDIPADALARAEEQLAGKDATEILVRQLAARLAGIVFDLKNQTVTIAMTDPDDTGVYQATIDDTSVPEHYTFYVTATGVLDDGVPFRREGKLETFVLVRPDPAYTVLGIQQIRPGTAQVTIVPRDRFGNVLLIDPATAGGFGLSVHGGEADQLTSNFDGTYETTVTFDPAKPPAIGLDFDGSPVIEPASIPAVDKLVYVNQVVDFDPGEIKRANRHLDPEAALGTVVGKASDQFVSLGAGGRLTVAVRHRVIKGGEGDDLTVFIAPDADPRAYRVDAYCPDRHTWVPLGTSTGLTASFSLKAGRVRSTESVRIVDLSGRTRDRNLDPLTTPGVSVLGIGARRVGSRHDDDHDNHDHDNHDNHDNDNQDRDDHDESTA